MFLEPSASNRQHFVASLLTQPTSSKYEMAGIEKEYGVVRRPS